MIARMWHGVVPREKAEAYLQVLKRTGVSELRATAGNRGVTVLRQDEGAQSHFVLISFWDSREAIRAFAGDDLEKARYYPEDAEFLLEMEPRVTHYEVLASPAP
jgi:heme-degrading monooxygenase HmoA